MWTNKVWNDIKNDTTIVSIEHPIYECFISKDEYFKEFSEILESLNGETMTDYVDFFFERDRVSTNSLIFIGLNEKLDFYDWAVECNCIPTLKEIHNGESNKDKIKREILENNLKSQQIQKEKQKSKEYSIDIKEIM